MATTRKSKQNQVKKEETKKVLSLTEQIEEKKEIILSEAIKLAMNETTSAYNLVVNTREYVKLIAINEK